MNRIRLWIAGIGVVLLAAAGCSSNDEASPAASMDPVAAPEASPAEHVSTDAIAAARNSMKAGNVDAAAAKLAQLQMQGAKFNAAQAKDYRQALSEAYDLAIEGAQRGDPKAQAALQLLRAAGPR